MHQRFAVKLFQPVEKKTQQLTVDLRRSSYKSKYSSEANLNIKACDVFSPKLNIESLRATN